MKINWRVRFKHKQFWIALISSAALFSNQVSSLLGFDITIISSQVQDTAETLLMVLVLLGVIVDPTTDGIKDSKQALTYEKPKREE